MNINQEREAFKKRLQSKEHRDAFVSASVDQTIPFQVRALRLAPQRNWTQEELAHRADMKQERISACENPNYGRFSLRTLKQLAAAFDVALIVRFAPFSELVEWETNLSSESLEVPNFDQEDYFKEKPANGTGIELLTNNYSNKASRQPSIHSSAVVQMERSVVQMEEYRQKRHSIEKESSLLIQNQILGEVNEATVR